MGQYYELYIGIAQAAVALRNLQITGYAPDSDAVQEAEWNLDLAITLAEEAGAI